MLSILNFGGGQNQSLQKFDGSDSGGTDSLHTHLGLVNVLGVGVAGLQDQDAVIGHIGEVLGEKGLNLKFALIRDFLISIGELGDDRVEQVQGIGQIHSIGFTFAANSDQLEESFRGGQNVEAVIILTEILQDGLSVQGLIEVVGVFVGHIVEEPHHDLSSLLSQHLLHLLLLSSQGTLVLTVFIIVLLV